MTANDRPLDRGIPQRGNAPFGAGGAFGGSGIAGAFGGPSSTSGTSGTSGTGGMSSAGPTGTGAAGAFGGTGGMSSRLAGGDWAPSHAAPRPDPAAVLRTGRGPGHPLRRGRRGNLSAALTVLALVVLLAPVVLLFVRLWSATADASATTTDERAAVAYARPVDKLLSVLVDAQRSAARKSTVDAATVRAAADDVDAVDRRSDDPLQVRSRWTQLRHEIDTVLNKKVGGAEAVAAYAAPIALTGALLGQLAESAGVIGDRSPDATQLTRVALRDLPDVLAESGGLTALAASGDPAGRVATDAQLAVVGDRLARSASDVSAGLRAGTDPGANYAVDLGLLAPLDAFSAAADALNQVVAGLNRAGGGARDQLDAANTLVKTKALDLQTAVLDAFDTQLAADSQGQAGRRRELVLAAMAVLLAAVALLWLGVRGVVMPRAESGAESGYADGDEPRPSGSPRTPDLVDARELISSQVVPANGGGRSFGRQDTDDPR
jgi:hypothetical protein